MAMGENPARPTEPPLRLLLLPLHVHRARKVEGQVGLQELREVCCSSTTSGRKEGLKRLSSLWKVLTSFTGKKDRMRFYNFFHEDHYVHPDNIFETIFGEHGCTWSHISLEGFRFRDTSSRFTWTDESQRERVSSVSSDESKDDNSETGTSIGSHAHRVTLGLPPCGPLTLDDVKTAFRASALRWHPDRHSGSSQAVAEEKFKLCVNAYNSISNVLKAA